ncbi:hypothetical protein SDC9_179578 [bioreactor metagenome]|uniref:Uncharacterized protein n=1 Tax=bioreactor metagenome TaxID=1076179 RepID=A0A645H1A6_9ZZZZ
MTIWQAGAAAAIIRRNCSKRCSWQWRPTGMTAWTFSAGWQRSWRTTLPAASLRPWRRPGTACFKAAPIRSPSVAAAIRTTGPVARSWRKPKADLPGVCWRCSGAIRASASKRAITICIMKTNCWKKSCNATN